MTWGVRSDYAFLSKFSGLWFVCDAAFGASELVGVEVLLVGLSGDSGFQVYLVICRDLRVNIGWIQEDD